MSTADLVKARLAFVRRDLMEAFARVDDGRLGWAPREGMPTVRDLLFEIAGTEVQIVSFVQGSPHRPLKEVAAPWEARWTVAEVGALLEETRESTLAFLDGLTESDFETTLSFPPSWFESLGLPEVPLREALGSLAAHEWYHTGQLVSYLWMLGEDPSGW